MELIHRFIPTRLKYILYDGNPFIYPFCIIALCIISLFLLENGGPKKSSPYEYIVKLEINKAR